MCEHAWLLPVRCGYCAQSQQLSWLGAHQVGGGGGGGGAAMSCNMLQLTECRYQAPSAHQPLADTASAG